MSVRTQACIDIDALHHNVRCVRNIAPHSKIMAMVKGNAYGHGLLEIGNILTEVDAFGVACLAEAIKLREGGIKTPIVIMSGIFTKDDLDQVLANDLQIVIHDKFQVDLIESCPLKKPITIWLKMDTGMHRLGFSPDEFRQVYVKLSQNKKIGQPIVAMTHFADADDIHKPTTQAQLDLFLQQTADLDCPRSAANSAGVIAWPNSILDWNRPGIMLYGVSPIVGEVGARYHLRPVMTLKSKVVAIHNFKQGDAIGYGGKWICPNDMRIAAVAIGYGDGYPRHAKNGTPTLINGIICPLVGRVSMDLICVDIGNCPTTEINDDVILWGNGLPAEVVAEYSETIAYELLCNVSQRVVFVYQ